MDTRLTIDERLRSLEAEHAVRILHAVESGSRAWGFPSTDSDYDVRFIYVCPHDWYLSLHEERDVIECIQDDENLDIGGWDLRKALRLFIKGNAALYEWLQSPVIYLAQQGFAKRLSQIAPSYYPLKAGLYHYLGLVKGVLHDLEEPPIKVKRCLYGLRAALAARWIVERRSVPPMTFEDLRPILMPEHELDRFIAGLIAEKAGKTEAFSIPPSELLRVYLLATVDVGEKAFHHLPDPVGRRQDLDVFFRGVISAGSEDT